MVSLNIGKETFTRKTPTQNLLLRSHVFRVARQEIPFSSQNKKLSMPVAVAFFAAILPLHLAPFEAAETVPRAQSPPLQTQPAARTAPPSLPLGQRNSPMDRRLPPRLYHSKKSRLQNRYDKRAAANDLHPATH